MVDFAIGQVAAFGEDAAPEVGFRVWRGREFFILRPVLGVQVNGFDAGVAVTLGWVWDVAAQSLVLCSGPFERGEG